MSELWFVWIQIIPMIDCRRRCTQKL